MLLIYLLKYCNNNNSELCVDVLTVEWVDTGVRSAGNITGNLRPYYGNVIFKIYGNITACNITAIFISAFLRDWQLIFCGFAIVKGIDLYSYPGRNNYHVPGPTGLC